MPTDPAHREENERRPDEHRDEREDPGGDPPAAQAERVRDAVDDREEEQRPARPRAVAVSCEPRYDEPDGRAEQDGQPARVDEEGRRGPDGLGLRLDRLVLVTLLPLAGHPERDEPEAEKADRERDEPEARDRRPAVERSRSWCLHCLGDEYVGDDEEADRPEDRPARALRPVRPDDVDERHERDDGEVECRRAAPVDDRHPDEQPARQMEPERRRLVAHVADEEVREPEQERDDRQRLPWPFVTRSNTKSTPTARR